MKWEYLDLVDGFLLTEDGSKFLDIKFNTPFDAEKYLIDNDIRGTVR